MDFIDNINNKRNRDVLEFSSSSIVDDLKNDTIEKLKNFLPNIKGNNGIKFINKLKHDMSIIISTFNINDVNFNCLKIQLLLCIDILDEVLVKIKSNNKTISARKCLILSEFHNDILIKSSKDLS